MFSSWSVRLLVCPWTASREELYSIFMKPCTIMYPCYRKNPLIFRVDPTQVSRLAAVGISITICWQCAVYCPHSIVGFA